ncbi:MAG: hypothetical protein HOP33_02440 [Verrucomicrobia bacterium]|nr:hypothetical protein [Verrucomicrobiota bacterium]
MKTKPRQGHRRFQLEIVSYGNSYYIERVAGLETALARKPRSLQLDMIGVGEISADAALRIRAALLARSPKTQIITNARSSLQNGSVLVWLLGDQRLIRDDATLYFRRANQSEIKVAEPDEAWKNEQPDYCDSASDVDPEEGDYARVLQLINEFLPVNELAGRIVGGPVLRQFGLVENEKVDHFLATALGKKRESADEPPNRSEQKRTRSRADASQRRHVRK